MLARRPCESSITLPVALFPCALPYVDTLRYALPAGHRVEAMAAPVGLETRFGCYRAGTIGEAESTLVYYRYLQIREPTMPAEEYEAFRMFLKQGAAAD